MTVLKLIVSSTGNAGAHRTSLETRRAFTETYGFLKYLTLYVLTVIASASALGCSALAHSWHAHNEIKYTIYHPQALGVRYPPAAAPIASRVISKQYNAKRELVDSSAGRPLYPNEKMCGLWLALRLVSSQLRLVSSGGVSSGFLV